MWHLPWWPVIFPSHCHYQVQYHRFPHHQHQQCPYSVLPLGAQQAQVKGRQPFIMESGWKCWLLMMIDDADGNHWIWWRFLPTEWNNIFTSGSVRRLPLMRLPSPLTRWSSSISSMICWFMEETLTKSRWQPWSSQSVELDEHLAGAAIQHREVQGQESKRFDHLWQNNGGDGGDQVGEISSRSICLWTS